MAEVSSRQELAKEATPPQLQKQIQIAVYSEADCRARNLNPVENFLLSGTVALIYKTAAPIETVDEVLRERIEKSLFSYETLEEY